MIKIIENAIDDRLANIVENVFTGNMIPWHYHDNIATYDNVEEHNLHYGFALNLLDSPFLPLCLNILYGVLIKENLFLRDLLAARSFFHTPSKYPNTPNGIHIDQGQKHRVCLYYINDSDGDTIFFNGLNNEIYRNAPKKNTAVLFDGFIPHCSSTPTNRRYILNFNFTTTDM